MLPLKKKLNEYMNWASLVKEQTGKSAFTQLQEIVALRKAGGQCGISDYYWYKLYDESYQLGRGTQDFLGWRLQQKLSLALNSRLGALPAEDKLTFLLLASSSNLPVAPIRACYHKAERLADVLGLHLRSRDAVGRFLRDPTIYPLFGKPSFSQQGYGAAYLAGYLGDTDSVSFLNGTAMPLERFLDRLDQTVDHRFHRPECGFIFQDSFRPAPEILEITQWPAICGVRVICLNGPDGVQPIRAIWKIAVPPNHVDNFSLGKNGNLLANVDLETGTTSRLLGGFWPNTGLLLNHPASGKAVEGFCLPGWNQILDACKLAGPVFPLMKIHHWDFALTDQGPMMLELNDIGGTEIAQLHGHGLLTEQTREFLKRYGNKREHPWIGAL